MTYDYECITCKHLKYSSDEYHFDYDCAAGVPIEDRRKPCPKYEKEGEK